MKPRVLLRRDVPDDLRAIVIYLEQFSFSAADRFIAAFFKALNDLAAMPTMGSPKLFRAKSLTGIRSWSITGFRKFLILYRPLPDGIDVLAIVHGARELRSLLLQRKQ